MMMRMRRRLKRRAGRGSAGPMILYNNDISSGLFLKFMYSISMSKYGVVVYLLEFKYLNFALVKIMVNKTAVRLL